MPAREMGKKRQMKDQCGPETVGLGDAIRRAMDEVKCVGEEPRCARPLSPAEIGALAEREARIRQVKQFRVDLDGVLQRMKVAEPTIFGSEARHEAVRKVQEGIMWLGMELKEIGEKNPYPNSYNPANAVVDPTAQGLKL